MFTLSKKLLLVQVVMASAIALPHTQSAAETVLKCGKIYVVNGRINRLQTSLMDERPAGFTQRTTIQQVGDIRP